MTFINLGQIGRLHYREDYHVKWTVVSARAAAFMLDKTRANKWDYPVAELVPGFILANSN